jgi:small-conductance mechanosensitive channel
MRAGLSLALATIWALLLLAVPAVALDPGLISKSEQALAGYRAEFDGANKQLRGPFVSAEKLPEIKSIFERIRTSSTQRSADLQGPLSEIAQQLDSLGPPPESGQEDAGVAKTRADLIAARDKLQSLKSQLDVLAINALQSAGQVTALQRDEFFERIFDRNRSILNPSLWADVGKGAIALSTAVGSAVSEWWNGVKRNANPLGLLVVPLFVGIFFAGFRMLSGQVARWMRRFTKPDAEPDDMTRLWIICRSLLGTVVALLVLLGPIYLALESSGYMTELMRPQWHAIIYPLAAGYFFYKLARGIAAPGHPELRIVDLDESAAARLPVLTGIIVLVSVFNARLVDVADRFYLGLQYTVGHSAVSALVLLSLLSMIVHTLTHQEGLPKPHGQRLYFAWASLLTPLAWLLIFVGFGALLLGYLSLADYLAHQLVRTGVVVTVLVLLYHLLDTTVAASFDPHSGIGIFLRRATGFSERTIERIGLILRTIIDLVFIVGGIPALLVVWTLNWVDFGGFINTLTLGFQVGNVTISPAMVFGVAAVLIVGFLATNLFNRWLGKRILSETRINKGVQDSILKGASYAGYVLAIGFALSVAGLNFTNLAIVAGALGVGIGFGLQSIVNNFVSGLIILAERPVRVGDWVAIADGEGIVRRINVRSTEIETFDGCSIILPNSQLVTGTVRNWTLTDNKGRVTVPITVEVGNDAALVLKLLTEAARQHSKVLTYPAPTAVLSRISLNGLEFDLRVHVADVFDGGQVASDLRVKLLAAFAENDVVLSQTVAVKPARA